MTHVLTIPDWRPATCNELLGHWRASARRKKADRNVVFVYSFLAGTPKATGKRRVDILVRPAKGHRRVDGDALWKSTLDALKHAELIVNDTVDLCRPGVYTPTLDGPPRTEIHLTDLEESIA